MSLNGLVHTASVRLNRLWPRYEVREDRVGQGPRWHDGAAHFRNVLVQAHETNIGGRTAAILLSATPNSR